MTSPTIAHTIDAMAAEPATVLPRSLGRYQVIRQLATGGMAEVMLARDGERRVVIKRIRPEQRRDPQFVRMFLEEARLAGSLHHPNIVEVLEIFEQDDESFFSMEYIHGNDLRTLLHAVNHRDDKVPIQQVIAIMCGAAAGLHHAHEKRGPDRKGLGIVHRDVSPANILVGFDGRVTVADFGIAKAVLRQVETRSGTLKGKVSYMSPEQVTGQPIDRRSDIFALGVVLWEVATARRLFKGDNDFLVMTAIVQGDVPRPSLYRVDLPRPLEAIILKALAAMPDDRFATAEELREALEAFAESLGMRPTAASIADYMKKLFGMHPDDGEWEAATDTDHYLSIDFDGSATVLEAAKPLDYAKVHATARSLLATHAPVDQTGSTTPFPWAPEPSTPRTHRGLVIGAVAAGALVIGGVALLTGGSTKAPTSIAQPAPAPAPSVAPPAPAPVAQPTPQPTAPAAVVAPTPSPAAAEPAAAAAVPEARPPAKPAVKPIARKPAPKPAATKPVDKNPKEQAWDPNALFAPK